MIKEILQYAVPISFWVFGVPAILYWMDYSWSIDPEPYWKYVLYATVIYPLNGIILVGIVYGIITLLQWLY